jgi:hypothetical protein
METQYAWTFDSNTCTILGHRLGCADLRKANGKKNLHSLGKATLESEDLESFRESTGDAQDRHAIRMCKCAGVKYRKAQGQD